MNDRGEPGERGTQGDDRLRDDELASLVRDVADGWTMPPQRLDQVTWHERARVTRSGRMGLRRGHWGATLGRSAAAAVAATVILSLAAVWLAAPRSGPGASPLVASPGTSVASGPSGTPASAAPGPSTEASAPPTSGPSAAAPTPLPAFARFGAPVSPSSIMVLNDQAYQLLDLTNGTLGQPITYSRLMRRQDGGYVCLCTGQVSSGESDGLSLTVRTYDGAGTQVGTGFSAGSFVGRPDPVITDPPSYTSSSADVSGMLGPDDRFLFVGWAVREPPVWHAGVDVVDLEARRVVQTVQLPDSPSSDAGEADYAWAPAVTFAPDGRHIAIRATSAKTYGITGVVRWSAPLDAGRVGGLTPFATGPDSLAGCDPSPLDEGFAGPATYYAVCGQSDTPVLRRVDLAGHSVGSTTLSGMGPIPFVGVYGSALDRASGTYFAWDASGGVLVGVDLASGRLTGTATVPKPSADAAGPLGWLADAGARLGDWLAPPAAAKMFLQAGLVLAPDGQRLYAIGVNGTAYEFAGGSSGVWVFDARSLNLLAHWTPTADFSSLAVSRDGAFVYAAGTAGMDAGGNPTGQDASVTVYDAATGAIRIVAGKLGQSYLDFSPLSVQR